MSGIVTSLGVWTWWILGIVLLALEVFAPGNVLVWFGIAAILTGVLALFVELTWQTEALVFVVLAVVLAIAGRRIAGTGIPIRPTAGASSISWISQRRPASCRFPLSTWMSRLRTWLTSSST